MSIQPGHVVDDFTFRQPDGSTVRLSELCGELTLLIFLRHLA